MVHEVKLQKRFSKSRSGALHPVYQLQIPKALAEFVRWEKGDVITISVTSAGNLLLSVKKNGKKSRDVHVSSSSGNPHVS